VRNRDMNIRYFLVWCAKRARKPGAEQEVLTKRDEIQEKLIEILGLSKNAV
jgi:hypothetical protein